MARIAPGTIVAFDATAQAELAFPPPDGCEVSVAVHPGALKASTNALTTVVSANEAEILWVGSVDEGILNPTGVVSTSHRDALARLLLGGPALWTIIQPGPLRIRGKFRNDTVYQGDRPWLVVGWGKSCGLLAMPLNDIGTRTRHYQCPISGAALQFSGSKDSKLEMNHPWSFPESSRVIGTLEQAAHSAVATALKNEYL